jgi:single-strand DNA-binding protein
MPRSVPRPRASTGAAEPSPEPLNEIVLVGRLSIDPVCRTLPSGDEVLTFRVVVERATGRSDALDCAAWSKGTQRTVRGWRSGDVVQVSGALRRRFWRTGGGAASRCEVEVVSARRLARAAR